MLSIATVDFFRYHPLVTSQHYFATNYDQRVIIYENKTNQMVKNYEI